MSRGSPTLGFRKSKYPKDFAGIDDPRVSPCPTTGCWLWTGATKYSGYARVYVRSVGKVVYAHRWYYEQSVGQIPDGLSLDHICNVPGCVNPDHLRPMTIRDNILRRVPDNCRRCKGEFRTVKHHTRGTQRICWPCHLKNINASAKRRRLSRGN